MKEKKKKKKEDEGAEILVLDLKPPKFQVDAEMDIAVSKSRAEVETDEATVAQCLTLGVKEYDLGAMRDSDHERQVLSTHTP